MPDDNQFIYDQFPYPSYLHAQMHPNRLGSVAAFFGMKPGAPEKCRVLEIGCGDGSSLLSFAYNLPESEFVGIDLSEVQINQGKEAVAEIGLKNLELHAEDIMNVNSAKFGKFDYISAHGVYSWTPDFVRRRVLEICREMLNPQGVAYVSYNAFPGCRLRQIMREMMLFHTQGIDDPELKAQSSLGLLNFLKSSLPEDDLFGKILEFEIGRLADRPAKTMLHDDFSEFHQPFYFHEFMQAAQENGLQYVSDVELFPLRILKYPPKTREVLEKFDNRLVREQYLDFLENRRFRQTLLCHKEVELNENPAPEILQNFRLSLAAKTVSEKPNIVEKKVETFIGKGDAEFSIDHVLTKASLIFLAGKGEKTASFAEALQGAKDLIEAESGTKFEITAEDTRVLQNIFMQLANSGFLQIHLSAPKFVTETGEKPRVNALTRWQLKRGKRIFTLLPDTLDIRGEIARKLILLMDGTRTFSEIEAEFRRLVEADTEEYTDREEKQKILADLPNYLREQIRDIAALAILEA